jgi:hypothetical protein
LSTVETTEAENGILILVSLYLLLLRADDYFDMAWVTLVRVDTTMSAICTTAGFLKERIISDKLLI